MECASDPLPDDVETLKRLLIGRDQLIEKLKAEIARLKRWRFGRSSERADVMLAQLQLALDELQVPSQPTAPTEVLADAAPSLGPSPQAAPQNPRGIPLRRVPRSFPEHLPRETIEHAPRDCTCPDCGATLRKLGEDLSEMLDYVPGYFKVIRHVRPKLSCSHCSQVVQISARSSAWS